MGIKADFLTMLGPFRQHQRLQFVIGQVRIGQQSFPGGKEGPGFGVFDVMKAHGTLGTTVFAVEQCGIGFVGPNFSGHFRSVFVEEPLVHLSRNLTRQRKGVKPMVFSVFPRINGRNVEGVFQAQGGEESRIALQPFGFGIGMVFVEDTPGILVVPFLNQFLHGTATQ